MEQINTSCVELRALLQAKSLRPSPRLSVRALKTIAKSLWLAQTTEYSKELLMFELAHMQIAEERKRLKTLDKKLKQYQEPRSGQSDG